MTLRLRCRSLLAELVGDGEADALLDHMEAYELADGAALFREGEPAAQLTLLCDGAMRLVQGAGPGEVDLGSVVPPCWLGEVSFVDAGKAVATALADGPCLLLRLERSAMDRMVETDPVLASVVLGVVNVELAARMRESSALIVERVDRARSGEGAGSPRVWVSQAMGWLLRGRPGAGRT